jgi:HD-GYP domain-containing protein (c-di-GMP phosphodiesterase class II)
MKDQSKTKQALIQELASLRQRISEHHERIDGSGHPRNLKSLTRG